MNIYIFIDMYKKFLTLLSNISERKVQNVKIIF